ncbi:MAG: FGGY family carbohydrate kinase [Nocardioidaceae bacterium]|nr:FGGY family carbohydrate kinase [Nocardioidaceae bacterium]
MPEPLLLGIDCSTTAAKAVVVDAAGRAVASGRAAMPLSRPRPEYGEQDPQDWWAAVASAVSTAVRDLDPAALTGLAIAHQRESFVCLDADGQAVRPAMLWLDRRAADQVTRFGTPEVHRTTGKPPNTTPAWYKLLWLREHEPEALERTAHVVDVQTYLVHRLTGHWRTSWGSVDPLGVLDVSTFDYDPALVAALGLDVDVFPELHGPGATLGHVQDDVADLLGLPRGLPVIAGTGDGQAASLGAGVVAPGQAYLNLGTGVVSGVHCDELSIGPEYRVMTSGVPKAYVMETFIGGGTLNISWFVREMAGLTATDGSAERELGERAALVAPGSDGLFCLPYWTGALTPHWEDTARGAFIGLTDAHTQAHLYRSVLEGIALEQRMLTDGASAAMGQPVERVIAVGGGSRSPFWVQMVADVLGRPVVVAEEPEGTCLGAAVLAAVGTGVHPDVDTAVREMCRLGEAHEPDPGTSATYDRLLSIYREVYPRLREVFELQAAAR